MIFRPNKKNWLVVGWLHQGCKHPSEIWDETIMHRMCGQMEVCPDAKDPRKADHYQVFVQFKQKKRETALAKLFPHGKWDRKAQLYGNAEYMDDYCTKEKTRKVGESPFTYGGRLIVEKKSKILDLAIADLEAGKSIFQVRLDHKKAWVYHHNGLKDLYKGMCAEEHVARYSLGQFLWDPVTEWDRTQVFAGKSGIGKTEFALAHFKNPCIVSHMDDLREFDRCTHDGIVFDDMSFDHLPRSTNINLVDITLKRSIHVRFTTAQIPAHTKKIFTTNNAGGLIFKGQGFDKWIDRRVRVTTLLAPGFAVASSSNDRA